MVPGLGAKETFNHKRQSIPKTFKVSSVFPKTYFISSCHVSTNSKICQYRFRHPFCWVRCPYWFFRNGNPDRTQVRQYSNCSPRSLSLAAHCFYHPQSGQIIGASSLPVLAFPCWATFSLSLPGVNSTAWAAEHPANRTRKERYQYLSNLVSWPSLQLI